MKNKSLRISWNGEISNTKNWLQTLLQHRLPTLSIHTGRQERKPIFDYVSLVFVLKSGKQFIWSLTNICIVLVGNEHGVPQYVCHFIFIKCIGFPDTYCKNCGLFLCAKFMLTPRSWFDQVITLRVLKTKNLNQHFLMLKCQYINKQTNKYFNKQTNKNKKDE